MSKVWFLTGASSGFGRALAEAVLLRGRASSDGAGLRSGIVAGPGQVVRVAERGFILAQPQQPCGPRSCRKGLAHAQGSEPGQIGAHDLIECE
jgi:NAD(P)-dependent dehydrogenase (short-subunit alcohol dehydrogenase family)